MAATRHAEKRPLIPATASLAFTTALADPENFTVPQQKRGHERRPSSAARSPETPPTPTEVQPRR
jgi:hypothetical protein